MAILTLSHYRKVYTNTDIRLLTSNTFDSRDKHLRIDSLSALHVSNSNTGFTFDATLIKSADIKREINERYKCGGQYIYPY